MSHIRDGFDRGFALARLAKQAKTQGDKRAAFTLLKQAIGVFMDLFPTIPDNRTQKMVAAVRRGTGVLRVPSCPPGRVHGRGSHAHGVECVGRRSVLA